MEFIEEKELEEIEGGICIVYLGRPIGCLVHIGNSRGTTGSTGGC